MTAGPEDHRATGGSSSSSVPPGWPILAVADSEAPTEDFIAAEHALVLARNWYGRPHDPIRAGPPEGHRVRAAVKDVTITMVRGEPTLPHLVDDEGEA